MKRIWKQALMILCLCSGLVLWACIITTSLQDPHTKDRSKRLELSSHLSALEREIELQKKESVLLLDKMRAKLREKGVTRDLGLEERLEGVKLGGEVMSAKARDLRRDLSDDVAENEVGTGLGLNAIRSGNDGKEEESKDVIAILLFVCNRPTVTRCLDQLLKYRPSETQFPILVSQDCGPDSPATQALEPYKDKITHIFQPDLSEIKVPPLQKRFLGYYKIARHYGWALNQAFNTFNYSNVIVVEDDLEVAPDFFEYFSATLGLLKADPTLWCVSAWNDNGKAKRINETAQEALYRTDFFPGLGWMLRKETWEEIGPKWPPGFWDDWMREPAQRKDRACIRPEISRTSTFGRTGVSQGTYYLNHLQYIKLNDGFVPFSTLDLSYLIKSNYDAEFVRRVYSRRVVGSVAELTSLTETGQAASEGPAEEFRLMYRTKGEFRKIALQLDIMEDFKAGVPRTAYRGVVSFMFNQHRVYLAPGANWVAYQLN